MLIDGNISFILIIRQSSCMVVTNDDTHTFSQIMNLYFVVLFFSFTIHVICHSGHMQLVGT